MRTKSNVNDLEVMPQVEYPIRPVRPPFASPVPAIRLQEKDIFSEASNVEPVPSGHFYGAEGSVPKGGWRQWFPPFKDVYRTIDGRHFFEFEFHSTNGGSIEIDIIQMPSYPSKYNDDLHNTHRLSSNHGNGFRVCFGDSSETSTVEKAKSWAGVWAEHTINLIENGIKFPNN
jgi:hypothetical protein